MQMRMCKKQNSLILGVLSVFEFSQTMIGEKYFAGLKCYRI